MLEDIFPKQNHRDKNDSAPALKDSVIFTYMYMHMYICNAD